jgi:hypothetical protein
MEEEEVLVLRAVAFNKAAVLLPRTGAVVCVHVCALPPFVHFATPEHPIRARAVLGPYNSEIGGFARSSLTSTEASVSALATTPFRRVLVED